MLSDTQMLENNPFPPEEESLLIASLRYPLACGVVLIHANLPGTLGNLISHHTLFTGIVPLFFAISGYLFYGHTPVKGGYWEMLFHKAKAILIPYFTWTSLNIGLLAIQHALHLFNNSETLTVFSWGMHEWLEAFGISESGIPRNFPLWYLQDLILIFLLSPILGWGLRKASLWSLPVLLALLCCHLPTLALRQFCFSPLLERIMRLLSSIGWFSFGGLIACMCPSFTKLLKFPLHSIIICLGAGLAHVYFKSDILFMVAVLASFWSFLNFGMFLKAYCPYLSKFHWSSASFILYCSHGISIRYLTIILSYINLGLSPWMSKLAVIAAVLLISEAMCWLIERQRILQTLFLGKRK